MKSDALDALLSDWDAWAETAERASDGWQSDYPRWEELMHAALCAMAEAPHDLCAIEKCWLLSEEDERLSDPVREDPAKYLELLSRLAQSTHREVRWQVYASLEEAGRMASPILEPGTRDPDAYVRRRAVLALANSAPEYVASHMHEYENDPDPYNRMIFSDVKRSVREIS